MAVLGPRWLYEAEELRSRMMVRTYLTYLKNILMMTKTETYSRKFLKMVMIYLKAFLMMLKTYLRKFLMMLMTNLKKFPMMLKAYLRKFLMMKGVSRVFKVRFKGI